MAGKKQCDRQQLKEKAFSLFARNYSYPEIEKELGVSARTLIRWKQEFKNKIIPAIPPQPRSDSEIATSIKNETSERISNLLSIALDNLENILTDDRVRPADKLKAISILGDWSQLGKGKTELEQEKDSFPVKIQQMQDDLSSLSDDQLKKIYFAKLNESA